MLEPCRDLSQQSITEHMTACVVDGFKIVEIDIEKCRIEYGRGILPFLLAKPLVEKMAIGQTCQAVIMSHEGDTLFNLPRAGYVPRHTGHTVATFARASGKPPIAKLCVDGQADQQIPEGFSFGDTFSKNVFSATRFEQVEKRQPFQLVTLDPYQCSKALAYIAEIAVRSNHPEAVGRLLFVIVEQDPDHCLALAPSEFAADRLAETALLIEQGNNQDDAERSEQRQRRPAIKTRHRKRRQGQSDGHADDVKDSDARAAAIGH